MPEDVRILGRVKGVERSNRPTERGLRDLVKSQKEREGRTLSKEGKGRVSTTNLSWGKEGALYHQ